MIRFSKLFCVNPSKIWISGVKCGVENIAKIVGVFDYRALVLTIDSVHSNSHFVTWIKNQALNYVVSHSSGSYLEVSVVIPNSFLEVVLEKAINEDPENIFIFNSFDSVNSLMYIHHSYEELVSKGFTDVFISFSLDENALMICVNKNSLQPKEVLRKIKLLRFR